MRTRQRYGYFVGLLLMVGGFSFFLFPGNERLTSAGPANVGHEALACADCHVEAVGSPIQQVNANVRYALNLRNSPVDFVHMEVDNATCLSCHDRPNDRHPTYRFEEPRFKEARDAIAPQYCASCHLEHNGVRITQQNTGYCVTCHEDIDLKEEPLDVSHAELAETGQWNTCLACHDFHGNHEYEVPEQMADMYDLADVLDYFDSGPSPYGDDVVHEALTERAD